MTVIMILVAFSTISCGGGDGGPLPQANPTLSGGGGVGGGGGGGGTGACEFTFILAFCVDSLTQSQCQQTAAAAGSATYTWSQGVTCASLGY